VIVGQERAVEHFSAAWASRRLHHAWLLAGPKGVGKASFAKQAARRVLADAAGNDKSIEKLVDAGSHPDMRWLERLLNERTGNLNRNISVDQVRELGEFMGLTAALSPWRVVVVDSVDDLEASGANALLKILEEPPANTLFFLVSHAPGRLLPTVRSRCRRLDFHPLDDDAMASILKAQTDLDESARKQVIAMSFGSAGRALAFAELDLAKLENAALAILRQGDPTNARRSDLASELGRKAAGERYAAFLDLTPSLIAREARQLQGSQLERALDAYEKARELATVAPRLSLDPAATVFQIGGILASVPEPASLKR
jgi:DNA polymerase-3 subunit delta'